MEEPSAPKIKKNSSIATPAKRPSNYDVLFQGIVAAVFFIGGIAIIGFQLYGYLRWETWTPLSVVDLGAWLSGNVWWTSPTDWTGLHKILDVIPVSACCFVLGFFILISE